MAASVRAHVSTPGRNAAPRMSESGRAVNSGPIISRAVCGINKPIQPMTPAMANGGCGHQRGAGDHRCAQGLRVDASARTSSSERRARLSASAAGMMGTRPITIRDRDHEIRWRNGGKRLPKSQNVIAGSWLYGSAKYFSVAMPAPNKGAHHHAGQNERQDRIVIAYCAADGVNKRHRNESTGKCKALDRQERQRKEKSPAPAQRRTAGYA